jgi:uncharacterized protein (DUF1499 family)
MKNTILVFLASLISLIGCSGTRPDLGVNNGALTPCPKTPNCVNSQAVGGKQYIQPIRYTGVLKEARARLLQILDSLKRTKIITAQENYIRAETTSALFRFVDDMEFYLPEEQTDETVIHIRSASRIGSFDFGVNRKRIERIRSKFQK